MILCPLREQPAKEVCFLHIHRARSATCPLTRHNCLDTAPGISLALYSRCSPYIVGARLNRSYIVGPWVSVKSFQGLQSLGRL